MKTLRTSGIRRLAACALLVLASTYARAQTATVTRDAVLHSAASSKSKAAGYLKPGDTLTLIEAQPSNGYLHVRTQDSTEGWAYARYVEVSASPEEAPSGTPPTGIYKQIDPQWPKDPPKTATFTEGADTCGPSGEGGDDATNLRKNRTDEPSTYYPVAFGAVAELPFPKGAPRSRANWQQSDLQDIGKVEGVPITVIGYLVDAVKQEGKESTNCGLTNPNEVDWHMYLTGDFVADDGQKHKAEAVIVETTPRVRKNHPNWHLPTLQKWVNKDQPVRISGWLMLDPEHQADIANGARATIWEIHPITHIEVSEVEHPGEADWKDLEDEQ